ncbi:8-oxo-dGTP diphosphatase MutT, partial [Sodalis-like symbiont of Bactericera trigonica]
ALYREWREETGIDVERAQLLATAQHAFAERQLAFYFYLVEQWRGTPCGNEGQPAALVPAAGAAGG